jgi:hypothetical protein
MSHLDSACSSQMSPEEAKVAELKKIVVACGVRKQWYVSKSTEYYAQSGSMRRERHADDRSKEFADLDSVSCCR